MSENSKIQEAISKTRSIYVSVTGLKLRGPLAFFGFWRHAIPSKIQADKAPGLLFLDLKTVNGFHHTLSIWEDKQSMSNYLLKGSHLHAMRAFRKIATGKVIGFLVQEAPSWDEALKTWTEQGREI